MTDIVAGPGALSAKGERTRERILDVALDLFKEQGYEATTMRAIAGRAGVSLGSSYYYFPSKDHLVQSFYWRMHVERVDACRAYLDDERDFLKRLRFVMHARLQVVAPYHAVSSTLFRTAADPSNPLNPFSAASSETREASIGFLREVVDGSNARVPRDLATSLPHLLWVYELGLVLFWVHDRSSEQVRSHELVDDSTDAIVTMLSLANLPVLRSVRKRMLRWVVALISEPGG